MGRDPRIERGMLAQLADRRRRLEAGAVSLGWKLGMGTDAAMAKLGISAPLVGFLLEAARMESGSTCDLSGWRNPRLEPEIAAWMGADLPGDASAEDARAAVAGLGVAIELVDPDPDAGDPEQILAGDIYQRHVLLGPVVEGASIAGLELEVTVNGAVEASSDDVTAATGDPYDLIRHVAATVASAGETLRAGEVVICGSIVPALSVSPGDAAEVTLDGLGRLGVRFA
jgi:2-keto-4-pentenoate hydratase